MQKIMSSQRQTDANRRNALLSTGPRTENGKQRSRLNALQHGLAAETVIVGLEDVAEYRAFEAEIVADYDPQSIVERELTYRLASLLWRLRRASLIETGLLRIQSEILQARNKKSNSASASEGRVFTSAVRLLKMAQVSSRANGEKEAQEPESLELGNAAVGESADSSCHRQKYAQRAITCSFLRLGNLPSEPFERIGQYQAGLWRQFVQTLFALNEARQHHIASSRGRFIPRPPQW